MAVRPPGLAEIAQELSCSVLLRKETEKPLREDSGKGCRWQSSYVLGLKEGNEEIGNPKSCQHMERDMKGNTGLF